MIGWLKRRGWQAVVVSLAAVTIVLGTWAFVKDGRGFLDALYLAVSLFAINAEGTEPTPILLHLARFTGAFVTFSTVVVAFIALMRGNPGRAKARRLSGHPVVVGTGPEALALTRRYVERGQLPVWVGDVGPVARADAQADGVILTGPMAGDDLRQILSGASAVIVTADTDAEAVRLARDVDEAWDGRPFVLLDSSELANQLLADRVLEVCPVPRLMVVAREVVAANPPVRDAACPPPIVVGDGEQAAEIVRHIARAWQEYGDRPQVFCVGGRLGWVEGVEADTLDIATLTKVPTCGNARSAAAAAREVLKRWVPPNVKKVASSGPAIIVSLDDDARAVATAHAIQARLETASVSVVVDSAKAWEGLIGTLRPDAVVSVEKLLGNPELLGKDRESLLRKELEATLGICSPISHAHASSTGGPGRVFEDYLDGGEPFQEPEGLAIILAKRLTEPMGEGPSLLDSVLAAGGIARTDEEVDQAAPMLSPAQLAAMAEALLEGVANLVPSRLTERDRWAWAVELAQRLPIACARAGWELSWTRDANVLPPTTIDEFAKALHAAYLVTSEETERATASELAEVQWLELDEFSKASNRASARDVAVKVASLRLGWRCARRPVAHWELGEAELAWLGEAEHRRWARYEVAHGRKHALIERWTDLTAGQKRYDTDAVLAHFDFLAKAGIEVFRPGDPVRREVSD